MFPRSMAVETSAARLIVNPLDGYGGFDDASESN
jgi:hypothetical protein